LRAARQANQNSSGNHVQPLRRRRSSKDTVAARSILLCRLGISRQQTSSFTSAHDRADRSLMKRTQKEIRVGIVGANARSSWAKVSHVPAIKSLPGLKLAAVATRNEQSAREAAEAFGADRWFSDPFAMIRDERIDVVTIAVKVPAHRELVLAALGAGKAVYCEAPLGRSVAETEEMASAVGSLHTAIGLQGRFNPAVRRAAELLSSGKIGRRLNARIVSTTSGFGPEMPSIYDYFNKTSSGANLLTITAGHTLDVVEAVLGAIVALLNRLRRKRGPWTTNAHPETSEDNARRSWVHYSRDSWLGRRMGVNVSLI
jgi:predicted dehydrogenase